MGSSAAGGFLTLQPGLVEGEGPGERPEVIAAGLEGKDQHVPHLLGPDDLGRVQRRAIHHHVGAGRGDAAHGALDLVGVFDGQGRDLRQLWELAGPVLEELVTVSLVVEIQIGHVPTDLAQVDGQVDGDGSFSHPALAEGDDEHSSVFHGDSLKLLVEQKGLVQKIRNAESCAGIQMDGHSGCCAPSCASMQEGSWMHVKMLGEQGGQGVGMKKPGGLRVQLEGCVSLPGGESLVGLDRLSRRGDGGLLRCFGGSRLCLEAKVD